MTDWNALDVELLLDAEEVAVDISTAKRLVTTHSGLKKEDRVAHFIASGLVGDDDANGSLIVRNDADVGTSRALASDGSGNDNVRILDRDGDALSDQSGWIGITLQLERRGTVKAGGSSCGNSSGSASGKGEDGKSLEKHCCEWGDRRYLKVYLYVKERKMENG